MSTAVRSTLCKVYQAQLTQLDQDLQGRTDFPVTVWLGDRQYSFSIWQGEQLSDQLLAYDTETAAIQGDEIPQLALAAVHGSQGSSYFIHPSDLARFIRQHALIEYIAENVSGRFMPIRSVP